MTFVITARRGDGKPSVLNTPDLAEQEARDVCRRLAENGMDKVTLHSLSDSGIIEPMAAWSAGGRRARKLSAASNGTVPTQRVEPEQVTPEPEDEPEEEPETTEAEAIEIPEDEEHSYEGFCVKCREKREFYGDVKEMSNGRLMAQGKCPTCQAGISRILPGKATQPEPEWEDAKETNEDQGQVNLEAKIEADEAAEVSEVIEPAMEAEAPAVEFSDEPPTKRTKAAAAKKAVSAATKAPPTRKRTAKKVADVPDEVKDMQKVAMCPQCGRRQPVMERAGLTIFMQHSAPGLDRCPGSTTVVNTVEG